LLNKYNILQDETYKTPREVILVEE